MTVGGNLGDLRGKFIMDRNLGARDTKFPTNGLGNLMYAFGRKDPFAGGNVIGSTVTSAYLGRTSTIWSITGISVEEEDGISIATSVSNPMDKYTRAANGTNWCSAVNSESIIWHDMEYDISSNGKSIFDPSPYGWKVPADGTWSNFSVNTMTAWNDGSEDYQYGRSYPADSPVAFYPASGCIGSTGSSFTNFRSHGQYWTSTPSTKLASYAFEFANSSVTPSLTAAGRAAPRCIRPVQHYEIERGY